MTMTIRIKPIENEFEYHEAVQNIEKLWGSPVQSFRGLMLEALITFVQEYEKGIDFELQPTNLERKIS